MQWAWLPARRLGKWKAGCQYTWMGASYLWFALKLLYAEQGWNGPIAMFWARLLGGIGTVALCVAFVLTLVSLGDYLVKHGSVFATPRRA